MAAASNESNNYKFTNSLINEKSPYLLQHAHNPVNWYAWNDVSLNKAKQENKLIFLSVGYSTCHWCHVMERESFENQQVANILNENFICIKLDREERPDIDKIYMNYVTAVTQHGGWPMSVWLTPSQLYPIHGGTYYPKQHFISVIQQLSELWKQNSNDLESKSTHVINILKDAMIKKDIDIADHVSNVNEIFEQTYQTFTQRFDERLGGFGAAPKFPRPVEIDFLFRYFYRNKNNEKGENALKMGVKTLTAMANGGMYDHLGGGFHRYSVDEYFHVPHFEKMLYDNAQLIITYLNAFQITKNEFYKNIAVQTLNYILRDMKMENGGIYSAEDADSFMSEIDEKEHEKEKKEGAFYIFKAEEFDKILTKDEAIILKELYMILPNGNTILSLRSDPQKEFVGYNVLYKQSNDLIEILNKIKVKKETQNIETLSDIEHAISSGNKKLFEYRNKRERPHLDNKIICGWNGLILSSFAVANKILKTDIYLETAQEIAQFIYDNMRDEENGYLYRIFGKQDIYAFCVDYSFLIGGLLDLYQCCFDVKWLKWAIELQNIQNVLFFDHEFGAYFDTVKDSQNLIMRLKEEYDGAEPCASSIAVSNLIRLYNFTKDEDYLKIYAHKTLKYMNNTLCKMPQAIPTSCIALDEYSNGLKTIVISSVDNPTMIGDYLDDEKDEIQKEKEINTFLNVLHSNFYPDAVCVVLNRANYEQMRDELDQMYGYYTMDKNNNVMAHVCQQFTCQTPTNDLKEFETQLSTQIDNVRSLI